MKNLLRTSIFGIVLLVASLAATAQSAFFVSSTNGTTLDTVTNTGVRKQVLPIAGFQDVVSIQVIVTNISGTTGGVIRLYGSNNGINFVRIPTLIDAGGTGAIDSLNVNVNAVSKIFRVNPHAYTYYQVAYTGASTMACKLQSFAIWRKRN